MNVIVILAGSLDKHCLGTYNPDTVCGSPAFEAFAGRSFVFDDHPEDEGRPEEQLDRPGPTAVAFAV